MLPITSLAAVALGAIYVALTANVIRNRGRERISVGTGSETLVRAIRAQGNFCESVPITLILLALAEANGVSGILLALVAAAFVAGRVGHGYSLLRGEPAGSLRFRMIGMVLTFVAVAVLGVAILAALALQLLR